MSECSGLPQISFPQLSEDLQTKVSLHRIPLSGSLEVTQLCNLRCVHCYIPEKKRRIPSDMELSINEIHRIIDEIVEAGCLMLLLTGGDPFIRKDFLEIYTYARNQGLLITLFTNGTLITPKIASFLSEQPPFKMEITLYGATQQTYENVTNVKGSFARCLKGIDLLHKYELPLSLKTMLLTINKHELNQMQAFAKNRNLNFKFDPVLHSSLDGSHSILGYGLPPDEIIQVEIANEYYRLNWPKELRRLGSQPNPGNSLYACGAGRSGFHINSTGDASVCIVSREPSYSLRNGSFQNFWESFVPEVINIERTKISACTQCTLRNVCPVCPGISQLENKDPEQIVINLCELTKLRWKEFVMNNTPLEKLCQ